MAMFKWISGCSDKVKSVVKCDHDWEAVAYYDWEDVAKEVSKREGLEHTPVDTERKLLTIGSEVLKIGGHIIFASWSMKTYNSVCLKCGQCHNGFNEAALWLQNEYGKKEKESVIGRQRAEKAKKLWKENCLFSDKTNEPEDSA